MTHKQKVKMARRMMTKAEIAKGVSPFQSKAWEKRKDARLKKEVARITH